MQSEEYVIAALRALAEEDCGREAPEETGKRVLEAFRRRRARQRWRIAVAWSVAAAVMIAVVWAGTARRTERPAQSSPQKSTTPAPQLADARVEEPVHVVAPTVPPAVRRPPLARLAASGAERREIVTEFFPLMDVAPPFERGELLRVTVPAATMRSVGLPVHEDRLGECVQADILVGQEGLARAIRFVRYEQ